MNQYQYILEPYSGGRSRFQCPSCEKPKQFTRYIHSETKSYVDDTVGRCNREVQCGYHYTPKQYFQDNILSAKNYENDNQNLTKVNIQKQNRPQFFKKFECTSFAQSFRSQHSSASFIEDKIVQQSLTAYNQNAFVNYLFTLFDEDTVLELSQRYRIGTSRHWKGATVFWQIDQQKQARSGKIMLYNANTGKRVKEPYNHITWVHKALKLTDFKLRQCLFGEYLLSEEPTKVVGIVESEKTAIIASAYLPKFLWLASGSLSNLTEKRCEVLAKRKVVFFPDLGAYDKWQQKGKQLGFQVSDLLERKARSIDKQQGYDLADYLTKLNFSKMLAFVSIFGKTINVELNKYGYPTLWDAD